MTGFGSAVAVGLCLTFCVGGSAWSAEAAPSVSRPLVADPSVRRGVLPNGLRYAVVRNATPKGGLSLRLAFDVGSLDETDAERGAAHFVEHMAFRGTRNFPDGQLDPIFAPMGVGFGRDQNAVTGLEATLYRLDLPEADAARRATALRWLRDVADGVRFDPEAVERERGVVLAEREARNEPEAEVRRAIDAFAGPELLATRRPPIGDLQVVRTISAAQLRAFYAQWYRPEHAALVVVGDGPAIDGVEAELARAFEDWRPAGAAPKRAVLPGPDPAALLSTIERERVTKLFCPPTVWISLLRRPAFDTTDGRQHHPARIPKHSVALLPEPCPSGQEARPARTRNHLQTASQDQQTPPAPRNPA